MDGNAARVREGVERGERGERGQCAAGRGGARRGAAGRGGQARVGVGSVARANPGEGRQFNVYGCSAPCLFADSLPMDHERERQYFWLTKLLFANTSLTAITSSAGTSLLARNPAAPVTNASRTKNRLSY
jgi:hypothetical protein